MNSCLHFYISLWIQTAQKGKLKHARKIHKHLSFHLIFFSFTVFNKTEFTIKLNLQCVVSPAYVTSVLLT